MYRSVGWLCARGSYPLPFMSKGEIVDQRLSLMSTQETLGATPILHGNYDLPNYYILGQEFFIWFLIVEMFPLIYGMPNNSSGLRYIHV